MFTGIIQEIGRVAAVRHVGGGIQLTIAGSDTASALSINDSVSINGVCQTVIAKSDGTFVVEAVEETLKKTTLGDLNTGSRVNLELAVRLSDRLGGHLVQGHVDCVGVIQSIIKQESSWLIDVQFPQEFAKYVIPVGSIAIDGISLTVAAISGNVLRVSIIPHTLKNTILPEAIKGSHVNLEFDLIGKYIERLMHAGSSGKGGDSLTSDKLRAWGY